MGGAALTKTISEFCAGTMIGVLGWFLGGIDGFIEVLLAFSVIDYFTGLAVAWFDDTISSRIGFNGILRKCVMFSLVGVANLIDKTFLGGLDSVRSVVIIFYVGNEGISIMENAIKLGVPFPKVLRKHFLQFLKDKNQEKQKNNV